MASLSGLKAKHEARVTEEKKVVDRQRNLLILILAFLRDSGYHESVEKLSAEAGLSLSKLDAADNMSLLSVLLEFENYYAFKFGRPPKLVRKLTAEETSTRRLAARRSSSRSSGRRGRRAEGKTPEGKRGEGDALGGRRARRAAAAAAAAAATGEEEGGKDGSVGDLDLGLAGSAIDLAPADGASPSSARGSKARALLAGRSAADGEGEGDVWSHRLLKPIGAFSDVPETRALAEIITRDIYQENPDVRWKDIVGLEGAKRLLKEAVVMPMKYPDFFVGLRTPWKGVLLYGPPGTGKTMLARAVATECRTTFFNISASSLVSKWRGDSEKLVRVLFELARFHAPSTIFIDEIDSLMGQRGAEGSAEHEASRRMKTELLVQFDGLLKSEELVFVLAASNLPWELDRAFLRRLEKRVLVPLPAKGARAVMMHSLLAPPLAVASLDFDGLAAATEGYSGSDITLLCKEAAMAPLRRMMDKLEDEDMLMDGAVDDSLELEEVSMDDVLDALRRTRPSAGDTTEKYNKWAVEFGSS